jgi:hypothetical protein
MKLKVAGDKKTDAQDNQRLEELDGTLKEGIADTEVSEICQSSFMCDMHEMQKRMVIKYACFICKTTQRTSIEFVVRKIQYYFTVVHSVRFYINVFNLLYQSNARY